MSTFHTLTSTRTCVAARVGDAAASAQDLSISNAVGRGGMLRGTDVANVQTALNRVPRELGGPLPALLPDGIAGKLTLTAIADFQQRHFGFQDQRVDVRGRTHAKISSLQPAKLERMRIARGYLERTLRAIRQAQTRLLLAGSELLTGGGMFGQHNLELADLHFDVRKSTDPAQALRQVGAVYTTMLSVFARPGGVGGWMAFEADPFTHPNWFAFTYFGGWRQGGIYQDGHRLDTIYLSDVYDRTDDDNRMQTLIHELAHFVGPATGDTVNDHAYGRRTIPTMLRLTPHQKQHNAEHFGNYAMHPRFE